MSSISTRMVGTVLAAAAVTASMVLAAPAHAAASGPGAVPDAAIDVACGATFPDLDGQTVVMNASNVNIRTGPGTDCASRGQVPRGITLNYFCYAPGHDEFTWTYLREIGGNGRTGWIRDDLLPNPDGTLGSLVRCPV